MQQIADWLVDGRAKAEYRIFVKALTAGLQFKQEFPNNTSNWKTLPRRHHRPPIERI
jgi:hypothetical protein